MLLTARTERPYERTDVQRPSCNVILPPAAVPLLSDPSIACIGRLQCCKQRNERPSHAYPACRSSPPHVTITCAFRRTSVSALTCTDSFPSVVLQFERVCIVSIGERLVAEANIIARRRRNAAGRWLHNQNHDSNFYMCSYCAIKSLSIQNVSQRAGYGARNLSPT